MKREREKNANRTSRRNASQIRKDENYFQFSHLIIMETKRMEVYLNLRQCKGTKEKKIRKESQPYRINHRIHIIFNVLLLLCNTRHILLSSY